MQDYIRERVLEEASHVIETQDTVRHTAKLIGVSKSTTHKDLTERLLKINPQMFSLVNEILEKNWEEKHIRGGQSTHEKYKKIRES